jgi:predicted nucleic-acid-binding protein
MITGPCSLDTSVAMRLLVGAPESQYQRALLFVEEQRSANRAVHVSDQVLAEAYFALQSFYKIPKADALEILLQFTRGSGVVATPLAMEVLGRPKLATAKPGFVDLLIHGESQARGHSLVTFEKAAKKLPSTVVL